jgi:hypothetical protein
MTSSGKAVLIHTSWPHLSASMHIFCRYIHVYATYSKGHPLLLVRHAVKKSPYQTKACMPVIARPRMRPSEVISTMTKVVREAGGTYCGYRFGLRTFE